MRVEGVHVPAEQVVGLVSSLGPLRIRMQVPEQLGQIDHPTQSIRQPIEHAHTSQKRGGGIEGCGGGLVRREGGTDATDNQGGASDGLLGDRIQALGSLELGIVDDSGGLERGGRRGACAARIVEDIPEVVVVGLAVGRP